MTSQTCVVVGNLVGYSRSRVHEVSRVTQADLTILNKFHYNLNELISNKNF